MHVVVVQRLFMDVGGVDVNGWQFVALIAVSGAIAVLWEWVNNKGKR